MVKVTRFTASWCQPCKVVAPILDQIQMRYPDVRFKVVDVDADPSATIERGISSVPTVIVDRDDVIVASFVGVRSSQDYEAAIKTALNM